MAITYPDHDVTSPAERAPRLPRRPAGGRATRSATLFLLPFGVLFAVMVLAPIGYALYESFFEVRRGGLGLSPAVAEFTGASNYVKALRDTDFMASILRVLLLGVVQVPVMLGLSLLLALLLDSRSARFRRTFRMIFFLPFAMPGAIAAIMWSFLYIPSVSPFTAGLRSIGLDVDFLSGGLAPVSIGNMMTWGWTGYNMLIIHSALQAIPRELYEAAVLDGCSGWRLAWHVKIPLVRPALILTMVFSIIGTAQLYTEPDILRRVASTVTATYTPIMASQYSANVNNYNFAAAQAVILAVLTFVLSFGFLKFVQRKGFGA
ncbi:carbohydrate ABC transporter permease [Nonomuraea rhodomycinica]|uniref:Sugar ABC transporter permease n=1 Tax=Nonomuraea rhodomycinica TaxID=1712872 RepID=A0A7Y6MGJ0_9ACTN|nr:sugar ABC transporter permease [Nonomuraea rhodomycinica]NUW46100.1 sugar ABC transporter permease [Nonomuraea rhodomycinica]